MNKKPNSSERIICDAFSKLSLYCQNEHYKGWDNFDGLNSILFKKSLFYHFPLLRLIWIQFFKRSPINLRKATGVPKEYNPKGLALFASGLIASGKTNEAKKILDLLSRMGCLGYEGKNWGYNFDWQSKLFFTPRGTPNIIATMFIANAFLDFHEKFNDHSSLETAVDAVNFILNHLILFENDRFLCFSYMPGSTSRVHNVNMLGAALLARIYRHTSNQDCYEKSHKAMSYSVNALTPEHAWVYGESSLQQFIDNFHTGFNLVALNDWMNFTGESIWKEELKQAYRYFLNTFWLEDGCPKYYHNSLYPIDIHCSAQGIVTCLKLEKYDKNSGAFAEKIALWAIKHMQDRKGYFYYQQTRWYKNKNAYIRWSQAWMFYALSLLRNHGI